MVAQSEKQLHPKRSLEKVDDCVANCVSVASMNVFSFILCGKGRVRSVAVLRNMLTFT